MNFVEEAKEYDSFSDKIKVITSEIKNIVLESKCEIEGNSFYDDNTLSRNYKQLAKQINLFSFGKNAVTNICEIGFNAGHSTILMLIGREKTPLNYTIFDIGRHPYTLPCLNYLQLQFQNVNFEYIEGDSTLTMKKWLENNTDKIGTYDLIHVDGGHSEECIKSDMKNADLLIKTNGIIIVDDTYATQINNCVEQYLAKGNYKEIKGLDTTFFPHRIIQKVVL
jgi:hypothetical protein